MNMGLLHSFISLIFDVTQQSTSVVYEQIVKQHKLSMDKIKQKSY